MPIEQENTIRTALQHADRLLGQAGSSSKNEEVLSLCRTAIREMLGSFLIFKGKPAQEGAATDLNNLLAQCLALEEEFAVMVEVIAFFARETCFPNEEREMVIDAANEVWDFILSYLPDTFI